MKILCVIDSLGSGGAQRQLVELAVGFKERGFIVSFLIYHKKLFFKERLDKSNIPVFILEEQNYLKRIFKLRKEIRNQKPDVVLSFLEPPNFICEIASFPWRRWKLIVGERSSDPKILKSFRRRFYRWMHIFADYIVANSQINIEIVKKINPILRKEKYKVIYNIVDRTTWLPKSESEPRKNSKFHLVVAASHQYLKNARGLIEAVHLLHPEEQTKLRVFWYGGQSGDNSFNEAMELVQKYSLSNIIEFYPASNKLNEIFSSCDAVGLFSHYEGLPNVICEAMMMGKPVIASRVSDIPILLDENFLFDPSNAQSIRRAISDLLKMNSEILLKAGCNNKEKANEFFNKESITDSYIKLF